MKKIQIITLTVLAIAAVCSCAKAVKEGTNEAEQRYFNAWVSINAPQAERVGRGIYVYPESVQNGTGTVVEKDGFAIVRYTCRDLDGNITGFTNRETAEQLGVYSPSAFYGADILTTTDGTIRAGTADAIIGMKVGSKKMYIVPSWLTSYANYATEAEYLSKESELGSTIYEMEIIDFTKNINNWELLQIDKCFQKHDFLDGAFNGTHVKDSTSLGFYFKMLNKVPSKKEFPKDTTIYINYTGSLLDTPEYSNGLVFDTTIENVAKDNFIYSSSRKYSSASVKWAESHSEITLDGSNVVPGFSKTLWEMANCGPGTKAVGVFYSPLGYSYDGNGSIPAYAPLVFEIEIVEKEE